MRGRSATEARPANSRVSFRRTSGSDASPSPSPRGTARTARENWRLAVEGEQAQRRLSSGGGEPQILPSYRRRGSSVMIPLSNVSNAGAVSAGADTSPPSQPPRSRMRAATTHGDTSLLRGNMRAPSACRSASQENTVADGAEHQLGSGSGSGSDRSTPPISQQARSASGGPRSVLTRFGLRMASAPSAPTEQQLGQPPPPHGGGVSGGLLAKPLSACI